MRIILLCLFFVPIFSIAQFDRASTGDPHKSEINKDIFRANATLSIDSRLSITANYEHEIKRPFTFVLKAGPSFSRDYITTDAFGEEQYRFTMNVVASGELRYYFNLRHRIKLEKTTRNFSAGYLSLEPFVSTKPFAILNNDKDYDPQPTKTGVYLNLGFQKQVRKTYFNAFFGTRADTKIYNHNEDVFDIIQGGVTVGRAF
ncbi:MAG: hypothetical protein ACM3H8_02000 [Sphingobacteriales bacterium]